MFSDEMKLLKQLSELRKEYGEIEESIELAKQNVDQVLLQRLKKKSCSLKEKIISLESIIYPDIIA